MLRHARPSGFHGRPPRTADPDGPGPATTPSRQLPRQRGKIARRLLAGIVSALGAAGFVLTLSFIVPQVTTGQIALAVILAFIPFVVVLAAVTWVDQWEPEPRWLLVLALLWGAGVATLVSVELLGRFTTAVYESSGDIEQASVLTPVVGAPLIEETLKGAGLLVVLLLGRRQVNGPVDGVVYAMVIGGGFAFTENILYFISYWDGLTEVFVMRGIMSPFVHPLFSACIGLAMGWAVQRGGRTGWLYVVPLGWLAAVGLHALWNYTAVLGGFQTAYYYFQIPFFLLLIALVFWLRRRESLIITEHLRTYQTEGWFHPEEVAMLTSLPERRRARQWAERFGVDAGKAMLAFQRDATALALTRDQVRSGRGKFAAKVDEQRLLHLITQHRREFLNV